MFETPEMWTLFNKVHIFELMKIHIYEPNISLISLIRLMLNYAKLRLFLTVPFVYINWT